MSRTSIVLTLISCSASVAAAASCIRLGTLPSHVWTVPYGVSDDGTVVAGEGASGSGHRQERHHFMQSRHSQIVDPGPNLIMLEIDVSGPDGLQFNNVADWRSGEFTDWPKAISIGASNIGVSWFGFWKNFDLWLFEHHGVPLRSYGDGPMCLLGMATATGPTEDIFPDFKALRVHEHLKPCPTIRVVWDRATSSEEGQL